MEQILKAMGMPVENGEKGEKGEKGILDIFKISDKMFGELDAYKAILLKWLYLDLIDKYAKNDDPKQKAIIVDMMDEIKKMMAES